MHDRRRIRNQAALGWALEQVANDSLQDVIRQCDRMEKRRNARQQQKQPAADQRPSEERGDRAVCPTNLPEQPV